MLNQKAMLEVVVKAFQDPDFHGVQIAAVN
jgi:hypothetical protein